MANSQQLSRRTHRLCTLSSVAAVLAVALAGSLAALAGETLSGKIVDITDGDTITVLVDMHEVKIRLAEIDTPERGQPWANRAKQALSDKVFGKQVEIEVVGTDRYGRTVGHVHMGDRDINREMVREGHAWVYRKYMQDPTLLDDESSARQGRLGLWSLPESKRIAPWEWRAKRRG